MSSPRLSPKLRLSSLWPALAAILIATLLLAVLLPHLLEKSTAEQLQDSLDILEPVVSDHLLASPGQEPTQLQRWVREMAGGSELRMTVVAPDGTVLADSARTDYQLGRMENHSDRPEIRQAWAQGRGASIRLSATTGARYAYSARVIGSPGAGGDAWVLRLAQPLSSLDALRGNLAATMTLAMGSALLVMMAISWWLDRRFFRPLSLLIEGAGQLAAGHYQHRVDLPEEEELAGLARALNRLAGSVEEQLAAVAAERDHLEAILASMSEGVLVVDRRGRAVSANPSFRRLFELEEEVEGLLPLEITRRGELATVIERTLAEGRCLESEIEIRAPERRTLALTTAALTPEAPGGGPDPDPAGAVVVARDTTESHRLGEMRRDFVANVSHELRTPLSAIRGFAETLRDGALDDRQSSGRFLDRILEQCRRLQALLDDLLTLSRLESIDVPPQTREPVDLEALVGHALELVRPQAEERGIRLEVDSASLPPIPGDAEGLERMLLNLLENGVKYNRPGGRVGVRLRSSRRPGGAGQVILEVTDDGIGIPADALPRIFERFYRVDKSRSREEGGTGLGLAIVKHVAQAHEGRVEVESELGRGTTFRVRLPLAAAADAES